jgi:hypothetical protein
MASNPHYILYQATLNVLLFTEDSQEALFQNKECSVFGDKTAANGYTFILFSHLVYLTE